MSNLRYIPKYTFSDYKLWKGDWELIDGHPVSMSLSPVKKHQLLLGKLYSLFLAKLSEKEDSCNCSVYFELDWKVKNDTIIRPDLVVVCDDVESDFIERVPAIVVEVLSPSTHLKDRNTKFNIYEQNGVSYYIMIDPDSKKIEVFQLVDNRYKQVEISMFKLNKDCTIEVDLETVFE